MVEDFLIFFFVFCFLFFVFCFLFVLQTEIAQVRLNQLYKQNNATQRNTIQYNGPIQIPSYKCRFVDRARTIKSS